MADFLYDEDDHVRVYIAGVSINDGQPNAGAGFGVVFNLNHPSNVSAPVVGEPTDITGTIQAATRAIREAGNRGAKKLRIYTDSQFLIDCVIQHIYYFVQIGWVLPNGTRVKNDVDFQRLNYARNDHNNMPMNWVNIEGHSDTQYYDLAVELAKKGANEYS